MKGMLWNSLSDLSISEYECEFVIPLKCLEYVHVPEEQIPKILKHDKWSLLINELFEVPKLSCSLDVISGLAYLDQWIYLFPSKCSYSLTQYSEYTYGKTKPQNSDSESIIEALSLIHISCIYINWLLSEENKLLIMEMLSSPNIKTDLATIMLILNNLNDAIDILELLSECKYLESIDLQYVLSEDIGMLLTI